MLVMKLFQNALLAFGGIFKFPTFSVIVVIFDSKVSILFMHSKQASGEHFVLKAESQLGSPCSQQEKMSMSGDRGGKKRNKKTEKCFCLLLSKLKPGHKNSN